VFCALSPAPPAPPAPPTLGGGDDDDADWVACGLLSSGNGSLVASTLRWLSALLSPWRGEGGRRGGLRNSWRGRGR
jgi:hypothetical protein